MRREEERAALRLLGLEPVWLDFKDAPYRTDSEGEHLYTSNEGLFGKVAGWERRELAPRIAAEVRRVARESGVRGPVRVFAPLGVGKHVDHQLVFHAARTLPPRYGVLYYEDYPYAGRPGALETRLMQLVRSGITLEARSTQITDLIGVKIAAITRYKSQLPILFGSSEAMPGAVRAYGQAVAGGAGYGERFWYVPPVYTLP
jgi:LmbE family N-acetylglucosaminyl deacetylase